MRAIIPLNSPVSLETLGVRVFALLAVLAAALCGARMLAAQAPATAAPSASAHKQAHPRKRPVAARAQSPTPQAAAATAASPAPEAPMWPANDKPTPASVTWDSHGLRIEAANSSLAQILENVATATGAKVEGFEADQRVFGVYGPGRARDVLSQLLLGSGYNVIMIGEQGQGTPREIVLSSRHTGVVTAVVIAAPASDDDSDTDEQPQPSPPPIQPGITPGGPPHIPQQIMQQRQPPQPPPGNP
ncbi:MAG: hypothetical protein WCA89_01085 [Terracidiphilus sp.]|jgi:hypothetical protein